MQTAFMETSQWDYVPIKVIDDIHKLTGTCVQVEDGFVKGVFCEGKGEKENG